MQFLGMLKPLLVKDFLVFFYSYYNVILKNALAQYSRSLIFYH